MRSALPTLAAAASLGVLLTAPTASAASVPCAKEGYTWLDAQDTEQAAAAKASNLTSLKSAMDSANQTLATAQKGHGCDTPIGYLAEVDPKAVDAAQTSVTAATAAYDKALEADSAADAGPVASVATARAAYKACLKANS